MNKKKVYIAGKIKGLQENDVRKKFTDAETALIANGYDACNPFEYMKAANQSREYIGLRPLSDENEKDRNTIMRVCVMQLATCDYIFLLHDWQDSEGAMFEKVIADKLGINQIEL